MKGNDFHIEKAKVVVIKEKELATQSEKNGIYNLHSA